MALPDGSGYRADLDAMTLAPLAPGQGRGAMAGGAVPGLSLIHL